MKPPVSPMAAGKPKLTTSAMIASIASEGQRTKAAPLARRWWSTPRTGPRSSA